MRRKLPPLKALHAFEAAARLLSFTRAADELGVTQGAVSKQVGLLEDYLGVRLFTRSGRQMLLTPAAEAYLPAISGAFDTITGATGILTGEEAGESLTVNILPSLSSRWLIPLLEDFRKKNPRCSVRFVIGDGPVDFAASGADIAIRAARKNIWRQMHAEPLMGEELLPVASPEVLAAHPVNHARDFGKLPLLQHTTRPEMWAEYLAQMGVKAQKVRHTLGFEHFFMLVEAAQNGLGVALIPRFLIGKELKDGSLAVAYAKPFSSPYRYYLICQKRTLDVCKVRTFRKWLMGQVKSPREAA